MVRSSESGPVIAGVGRSEACRPAVEWAAGEAALRHLPLRLVHALEWPPGSDPQPRVDHPERTWSTHYRAAGEAVLLGAVEWALGHRPGLDVRTRLLDGSPVQCLREQGDEASLLVVGACRLSAVEDLVTPGSTGVAVAARARCPVAVVRRADPAAEGPGEVVVGVDGSPNSAEAVAFAFREAALRGARLRAVQVQPRGEWPGPGGLADLADRSRAQLSEATAGWRETYPEVALDREVLFGGVVRTLVRTAAHARCLVVGSRGLGGVRGLLLGSVCQAVVHRAHCPVVVVPPDGNGP